MNQNQDEVTLKEFVVSIKETVHYLKSHIRVIIIASVVGLIIGLTYSFIRKTNYTATTTFVLEDDKSSGGGLASLAGLASVAGVDLGGGGGLFQGENILELYKSRKMIEKTLLTPSESDSSKLLIDYYIGFKDLKKKWEKLEKLSSINFIDRDKIALESSERRLQDSLLGEFVKDILKNHLKVTKPDKKLNKIEVDVVSVDEVFAKEFNDIIVENVNQFYKETKTKKSLNNIAIIQRKTDSVRAVMEGAIVSGVIVSDATLNSNPARQILRTAPLQKSQFAAEANKEVLGELLKNLEISKMSMLRETPLIQIVDDPVYPLFNDKMGRVRASLSGIIFSVFLCVILLIVKRIYQKIIN